MKNIKNERGRLDAHNIDEQTIDLMKKRKMHSSEMVKTFAFNIYYTVIKYYRHIFLTHTNYIRRKLVKDFIFQIYFILQKHREWNQVKNCVNCIKVYHEKLKPKESTGDDGSISQDGFELGHGYIDQDVNRSILNGSATLLGKSPMKTVLTHLDSGKNKNINI